MGPVPSDKKLEEMRDHLYGNLHVENMSVMILDLLKRVRDEASSAYRCYSCKQVFEEDHGHGLAHEHFGSHLAGDKPKCIDILNGGATWGGGPHDTFYRVRKDHYEAMEKEIADLKAAPTGATGKFPLEPTAAMKDAGAQRLVSFEDGSVWPDSWDALQVATARNEAERVWRSMWIAATQ